MIGLTINGQKIETPKGSTILEAALGNGIKIPNLCHDKRLKPHGGCRLCIVEIEGQKKLEASCATLATEGLVVWTETPKVRRVRETVLELMLVHHPLDCPVCDKAGECALQDLVFQYGRPSGRFHRAKKQMPTYTKGPLMELNANRCILCGKCVRLCSEHQCRGALGFIGRGFPTVVQPAFGEALECDYCGQCRDVCPTGAILNKSSKLGVRPWFLEEKETICSFCSCGCTLTLGTIDGKITRSRGKEGKGVSGGDLCGRGRFGFDYIYSEGRLKSPMIRRKGVLVPVSWDEAISFVSTELKRTIKSNGPSSIGGIGSPRCTNEENYLFQKFMREAVGSQNIDSAAAFGYGRTEQVWNGAFGISGHTADLKSPLGKDVILVIESDPSITHPVFGLNILQARRDGSQLIVADNRDTKLTRHSTRHLKISQGTGAALLNGMIKIIMERGLFDKEKAASIEGYPAFRQALEGYTPEKVCGISGITKEELSEIAETFANARSRLVTLSVGVSENSNGKDAVAAAANLINLLGDSPEAIQIPAECSNTFGLYRMGVRNDAAPFYAKLETEGKNLFEMLYQPGTLKALYIMGADPAGTFPDGSKVTETLKTLDLLIVQDIALTKTAEFAHVVLPAASWAEKEGSFTNTEGLTQTLPKIVKSAGQSLADWEIIKRLSSAMGNNICKDGRAGIGEEISSLRRAFFGPLAPKRAFVPARYETGEAPDREYPLKMVLRDVLPHTGSMSTRSKSLNLAVPEALLEINWRDAKKFGIPDYGHVRVSSRRGAIYLKSAVSENVPEGVVYVASHFPHNCVTALTHVSEKEGNSIDAVRVESA